MPLFFSEELDIIADISDYTVDIDKSGTLPPLDNYPKVIFCSRCSLRFFDNTNFYHHSVSVS